jgi:diguanylate cyclase (GGDEF)-like protein/PAS domain S-box-containing protein
MLEHTLGMKCLAFFDHFFDGVYVVDTDRRIVFWNRSAELISGYTREEVLGKSCADNLLRHVTLDGESLCRSGCPLRATMDDGLSRSAEVYLHHKHGHRVPVHVRANPLRDDASNIVGAVEIFADNTRHEAVFRQLKDMERSLYQDALTGIGNRKFAEVRLSELMGAFREHGQEFGCLFADIDHFKSVNDTYGHAVGDKVIALVARTLQNGLRPTDRVCRYGGEEFVCLLPNIDMEELLQIAERVRMLVERAWLDTSSGGALRVTISVGGAVVRAGDSTGSLVERADRNMYHAKQGGRNRVVVGDA